MDIMLKSNPIGIVCNVNKDRISKALKEKVLCFSSINCTLIRV